MIYSKSIETMSEWKTYRLGDIVDLFDYKRIPLSSSQRLTRKGIYPYYGAQGIIDYVDDYIFDGEYLLIAEDGENLKSKKQDIAQIAKGKYWVNNHAHILQSNGLCNITYLCYVLNHIDISGYITGSAQPKLNQANLLSITLSLPPIEEQNKIASIILSFDDKIELNRRINANLEEQAQALFKSWFVDFEPFRDGPFVDSELGKIPQGWKVGTASEFYKNITIGKTPPRKEQQWFSKDSHDIVWVSIADMGNCGLSISNSSEYLTPDAVKKFNICIVPVNTVLLSFKLTIGRVAIADKELATNEAIAHFQTQHNTIEYTYLALKNYEFSSLGSTSSIATAVNSKIIKSMPWMMPSDDVLNQFHNVLSPIFDGIRNNIQKITCLSALRDTLLPKLMAGEL